MRPLKFRAWNKPHKKMFVGVSMLLSWDDENKFFKSETNNSINMQYVGLKDKNDVEVYEGDYIKDKYNGYYLIGYDESSCGFVAFAENSNGDYINDIANLLYNEEYEAIVIGNEYEENGYSRKVQAHEELIANGIAERNNE